MAKKQYVANEVNPDKVSETPTVLVETAKKENELSPNPAGSGFVKQHFVDSLPVSGNANELYIIPQKANGGIVGYKNYKYNVATKKWERVFGSDPLLKLTKGGQGTLAHTNNPEKKAFAKIFNGNVAIVGGKLYVDGKEVGQGGGGSSGDSPKIYNIELDDRYDEDDGFDIPVEILEQLKPGDVLNVLIQSEHVTETFVITQAYPLIGCLVVGEPEDGEITINAFKYLLNDDEEWERSFLHFSCPSPSIGNEGDVLTINEDGYAEWKAPSGGTEVIANPQLSGSETLLNALQVGENKFKVETGKSHFYSLEVIWGNKGEVNIDIFCDTNLDEYVNTPLDSTKVKAIKTALANELGSGCYLHCHGLYESSSPNILCSGEHFQLSTSSTSLGYVYEQYISTTISNNAIVYDVSTGSSTEVKFTDLQTCKMYKFY